MKIGQPSDIPQSVNPAGNANAQKPAQTTPATASATASQSTRSAGVAVTVSTLARALENPEPTDTGEIDTAKVDAVRSAIADGTYVVNAEAIADKLLSNAQELLNRTKN